MSRRDLLGLGVAACVACCIGPILGLLGVVGAIGIAGTALIGAAAIVIACLTAAGLLVLRLRWRRLRSCATDPPSVAVELSGPPR